MGITITIFRIVNLLFLGNGFIQSISTKLPPHLIKSGQFQFLTNCSLLTCLVYIISTFFILTEQTQWLYNLVSNLEFNVLFSYWTMALCFRQWLLKMTLIDTYYLIYKYIFPLYLFNYR